MSRFKCDTPEAAADKLIEHSRDVGQCRIWNEHDSYSRAYMNYQGRPQGVRRVSYQVFIGDPPKGKGIVTDCGNDLCINPDHLTVANRGPKPGVKTHCPKGHPYDEANTYIAPSSGSKVCRTCARAKTKIWYQENRASKNPPRRSTATHCAQGHSWEGNLRETASGKRACRACEAAAKRRQRANVKAES